MATYRIEDTTLTNIANAIRNKTGTTSSLSPTQMASAIAMISGDGGGTSVSFLLENDTEIPLNDNVTSLSVNSNNVLQVLLNGTPIWGEIVVPPKYNDLVPTALNTDGTVLDGIGYRTGVYWNSNTMASASAFTAIGLIPFDGIVVHDIYLYGIDLTGTARNRYQVHNASRSSLSSSASIKEGFSSALIESITKLDDYYFKITTKTGSTNIKYFAISGVTVSGLTPIVTLDEPIF